MTEFLKTHQLNIMLFMSGMCGILALLSLISRVLTPKRRRILTLVECAAMLLLIADRFAYRFRGDPSELGFRMVRISNFLSFFLMLFMVHEVTWHTDDQVNNDTQVHMTDAFPGWDKWTSRQKEGIDCGIILRRENDSVILRTENLGISIHSVITIRGFSGDIYAALTGDQCAITEIQITGQGKKEQAYVPD